MDANSSKVFAYLLALGAASVGCGGSFSTPPLSWPGRQQGEVRVRHSRGQVLCHHITAEGIMPLQEKVVRLGSGHAATHRFAQGKSQGHCRSGVERGDAL